MSILLRMLPINAATQCRSLAAKCTAMFVHCTHRFFGKTELVLWLSDFKISNNLKNVEQFIVRVFMLTKFIKQERGIMTKKKKKKNRSNNNNNETSYIFLSFIIKIVLSQTSNLCQCFYATKNCFSVAVDHPQLFFHLITMS